jgi:ArsR family transcriptional regulator, arsenate/arsenite/antimonite-responsive transcriptional repressor
MMTHELFKGLADPIRLRIAVLLLDQELCVCDLMGVLQIPQSTVSRHMGRMKAAGLVTDRRSGKWVHYQLADTPLVNELRDTLTRHLAGAHPFRRDIARLKKHLINRKCT